MNKCEQWSDNIYNDEVMKCVNSLKSQQYPCQTLIERHKE